MDGAEIGLLRHGALSTNSAPWYHPTSQRSGESKIDKPKSKSSRHRPKLGQHFLHDQRYRNKILEELDLKPDDVVIEIGPGQGALTFPVLKKIGHLEVIELDRAGKAVGVERTAK